MQAFIAAHSREAFKGRVVVAEGTQHEGGANEPLRVAQREQEEIKTIQRTFQLLVQLDGSVWREIVPTTHFSRQPSRDVALAAVQAWRRTLHVLHKPLANSTAREWLARLRQQRELRFKQRVHALEVTQNPITHRDVFFEEHELLLEHLQGMIHHILQLRLSLCNQRAFLLDIASNRRQHQFRIDVVIPVDEHDSQLGRNQCTYPSHPHPIHTMRSDGHVVALHDIGDVHGNGRVRADSVLLHQADQFAFGEIARRAGEAVLRSHAVNLQHIAL